jgi:hypothetical protein
MSAWTAAPAPASLKVAYLSSQNQVIGATATPSTSALVPETLVLDWPRPSAPRRSLLGASPTAALPVVAAALVVVPVFLQAPWVRLHPSSATLFTAVILTVGLLLELRGPERWRGFGPLLVGFSGSWLAGCVFWGWCRLHPLWHLPIEALAGLSGRWRSGALFYLASLLGTACTDGAMALTGVMPLWPQVLSAPVLEAPALLHGAALQVLRPAPLALVLGLAFVLTQLARGCRRSGPGGRLAASTLVTTLVVDGLFLIAALFSPQLSGLV